MDLTVEWQPPVELFGGDDRKFIYNCDLSRVEDVSGVYVFARRHGRNCEALYVGKALDLRQRVKTQLQNVRLMLHVQGAPNGRRLLIVGHFIARQGQQPKVCLPLIERALIRYYLSEAHDLANKQGTSLRRHSVISTGAKGDIPEKMSLEAR
jgi:hypothetical protein